MPWKYIYIPNIRSNTHFSLPAHTTFNHFHTQTHLHKLKTTLFPHITVSNTHINFILHIHYVYNAEYALQQQQQQKKKRFGRFFSVVVGGAKYFVPWLIYTHARMNLHQHTLRPTADISLRRLYYIKYSFTRNRNEYTLHNHRKHLLGTQHL